MRKIVLLCAAGMSTSALVKKMRNEAAKIGYECTINAYGTSEAKTQGTDADVILLGPQVRFNVDKVKQDCPGVPVEAINTTDYGMMDGAKVIARVKEILGD